MPLFSRSSFRTPKKPPRRNKSLPNLAGLDDSLNFTTESIKLDVEAHAAGESTAQNSLVMKLGEAALSFEDGQWVTGQSIDSDFLPLRLKSLHFTQLEGKAVPRSIPDGRNRA